MIEVNQLCGQLYLGKQGENLARIVYFEEHALWEKEFGEGKCELLHQRYGDEAPYPVKLEKENGKCCWKVTSADTAIVGDGKCELHYIVDDVIVKSKVFKTTVIESLGGDIAEVPEPEKAWVDAVLEAAQKVEDGTTHQPTISENKTWLVWNPETSEYIDTGISAEGTPGVDGKGIESMGYYDTDAEGNVGIAVFYTDGTIGFIWIPNPKGEDGADGVGIEKIETIHMPVSEYVGFTEVTIRTTDGKSESFTIPDGKTPEKGVDYWTEEDKKEIISEIPSGGTWEKLADITTTEEVNSIIATAEEFPDMPKCKEFIIRGVFPKSTTGEKVTLGAAYCYLNANNSAGFRFASTTIDPSGITEHRCHITIAGGLIYSVGTNGAIGQAQVVGSTSTLVGDRFISSDVTSVIFKLNESSSLFPIGTRLYIYGKVEG